MEDRKKEEGKEEDQKAEEEKDSNKKEDDKGETKPDDAMDTEESGPGSLASSASASNDSNNQSQSASTRTNSDDDRMEENHGENQVEVSSPYLRAAVEFFRSKKLSFHVSERTGLIDFGIGSDKVIHFQVRDHAKLMSCMVIARHFSISRSDQPRLHEYCALVNNNIMIGNFEVSSNGILAFRGSLVFQNVQNFPSLIGPMFSITLNTFNRYLPGAKALVANPLLGCKDAMKKKADDDILEMLCKAFVPKGKKREHDSSKKEGEGEGDKKKEEEVGDGPERKRARIEEGGDEGSGRETGQHPLPSPPSGEELDNLVAGCRVPVDLITLGKRIGKGGFSKIYMADYNGTEVAVKRLTHILPRDMKQKFFHGVVLTQLLTHPHVVPLLGIYEQSTTGGDTCNMVVEYMEKGSLWDILQKEGNSVPWDKRIKWLIDVAKGMCYLHSKHATHGDLKSRNVLINIHDVAKIADTGLSFLKRVTAFIEPGAAAFTPAYAAPEVFDGEATAQSDVYSFGIMMWEVLTVATPYTTKPPGKLKKAVKAGVRPDIPDDTPSERTAYIALMKRCWQGNPSERPTFRRILSDLRQL